GRGGGVTLTVSSPELTNSNLREALFSPRSVAIVGQSDNASKAASRPLKFLRRIGYAGRVYPINPRRETVLGEPALPALAALPEPPEHALYRDADRGRRRGGRGMRGTRRQGRDRAGRRFRGSRRRRRGARGAPARDLRADRHPRLETMRHADTLQRFAHSAAERGKPIIAYKLGRSDAARELAVSHTGALAGEDDIADQFLKS